jgi:hypothetical protein
VAAGKHGPNRLSRYLEIHNTVIQRFFGGDVVSAEELTFSELGDVVFLMEGTIYCAQRLRIEVSKRLEIVDGLSSDPLVRTVGYSYSAVIQELCDWYWEHHDQLVALKN